MKNLLRILSIVCAATLATAAEKQPVTFSSVDRPGSRGHEEMVEAKMLEFDEADLAEVLDRYKQLSHRAIIRGPLPAVKIMFDTEVALTRVEALQALDTLLSQNGITMIPQGTKFMKAVPAAQAVVEAPPVIDWPVDQLPDSGTYIQYKVELKNCRPRDIVPALQPLAKMPNSVIALDQSGLIILRDYSANIRRMLPLIEIIEARQKSEAEEKSAAK